MSSMKKKNQNGSGHDDNCMSYMESSFETRAGRSFATAYQVGEADESGFVHIGIEERQIRPKDMNNTFFGNGGPGQFNSYDDDTSSSGYTSDASVGRAKKYQQSFDFLVEQGVRVRDTPLP